MSTIYRLGPTINPEDLVVTFEREVKMSTRNVKWV